MTREEAIQILSTRDRYGVPCGYTSGYQEALDMAIEALQTEVVRCKDCDNYEGEGMYCAWGILTGDMGYCHHARPKGGTDIMAEQTEPQQKSCATCKHALGDWDGESNNCERCCGADRRFYEPKDKPQTEYDKYREKIRPHDPHKDWFEDDLQTERSE